MARRRGRGWVIALVVVALIVIAVAVWWMWYTRTPEYSVRMVAKAVHQGDWQAFASYVDVDAMVTSAVDAEIERRLDPESFAYDLAQAGKPQLKAEATRQLREAIEARRGRSEPLPSLAYALGPADIEPLPATSASDARFAVTLPVRGKRLEVRMRLVRAGDRWRVVEVEDVGSLMKALGVG